MTTKRLKKLLLAVAILVLLQDTTGLFFNKTHELKLARNHPEHSEIFEFRLPDEDIETSQRQQKQIKVYQNGKQLHGPYASITPLKNAGPGNYAPRKRLLIYPLAESGDISKSTFTLWQPAPVPAWLSLPLYASVLIFIMIPWTWRYHRDNPIPHNKIACLESARGIACIIVVLTHFFVPVYAWFYDPILPADMSKWHIVWLNREIPLFRLLSAGTFAVYFFFVLSGYVLALPFLERIQNSGDRFRTAIIRRPFRLAGVVVVVMTASYLMYQGGIYYKAYGGQAIPWSRFVEQLFFAYTHAPEYNAVFWTIRLEVWGAIGVYLFLWLLGGTRLRWAGYIICFLLLKGNLYQTFLFGVIIADLLNSSWRYGMAPKWAQRAAPVMLITGLLLGSYNSRDLSHYERFLSGFMPDIKNIIGGGYLSLGAVLLLLALLSWPRLQQALTKPILMLFGRWSYTIYAVHSLVLFSLGLHLLVALHPESAQYSFSFKSEGWYYHLCVIAAFLVSMVLIIILSAWLTAAVDEPCVRISRRFAAWIGERKTSSVQPERVSTADTSPINKTGAAETAPVQS